MLQNRIDENRVNITTSSGMDITLFANDQVPLDKAGLQEIDNFSKITSTIEDLNKIKFFGETEAKITKCILTPDMHKGVGVPIGTVFNARGFLVPSAPGTDIGCGMRFLTTNLTKDEINSVGKKLDDKLRHVFFEGARGIALSAIQREAIFREGIPGLLSCKHYDKGIWEYWDQKEQETNVSRMHQSGYIPCNSMFDFTDYIKGSGNDFTFDDTIGAVGGGNHFSEIQVIDDVFDSSIAYEYGIKKGSIALMIHTGSLSIGSYVGNYWVDEAKKAFPKIKKPEHGFYMLPHTSKYLDAMANAANFAFANRLFLELMIKKAFSEALGKRVDFNLVCDAPHNMIWGNGDNMLHRKGACPAEKDSLIVIPGSMGSSSYLLQGCGNEESFCSACHGAGRITKRSEGRKANIEELEGLRIVTKIDLKNPTLRKDILQEYQKILLEEAPKNYKDVTPVIQSVVGAGIANKVAKMWPLLTIKG